MEQLQQKITSVLGDVIDGFEGVIGYSGVYSYNDYRLFVTNTITKDNFIREDSKRTQAPVLKQGRQPSYCNL